MNNSALTITPQPYVNPATGHYEETEAWKPLPGFEERYLISSLGKVWDCFTRRQVNIWLDSQKGYALIQTRRYATKPATRVLIRRAVAKAFLPNPQALSWVISKDQNPRNCRVDNLAWVGQDHHHVDQPATLPTIPFEGYILDRLQSEGRLTASERQRAGIVTAQDDSMAPLLIEGVRFVAVPVGAADYTSLLGKVVAVVVKAKLFAFYLGRLVSIDDNEVVVSRDNPQWPDRTESRDVIARIARVVSVLETPVC